MSNQKTTAERQSTIDFRWIVSHATSSHEHFGPDLIAVRIDANTAALLRYLSDTLLHVVERSNAMASLRCLGARVDFLHEIDEEIELGGILDGLHEEVPIVLPFGTDLPISFFENSDICSECDSFTISRVSSHFAPEIRASAMIKHTKIEVESRNDLWPFIEAAFPAPLGPLHGQLFS